MSFLTRITAAWRICHRIIGVWTAAWWWCIAGTVRRQLCRPCQINRFSHSRQFWAFNLHHHIQSTNRIFFKTSKKFFLQHIIFAAASQMNYTGRHGYKALLEAHLQSTQPFVGEFWSTANSLVPNNWEISDAAEVLCDSNCVVKVDDDMPPASRYKHRLTRTLK